MDDLVTKSFLFEQLAIQSGDIERRFNARMDALEAKFDTRFDQLFTLMDGFAKRVDDDDKERATITAQLTRHDTCIGQLASETKLTPKR